MLEQVCVFVTRATSLASQFSFSLGIVASGLDLSATLPWSC